jgi:hypothetical protein
MSTGGTFRIYTTHRKYSHNHRTALRQERCACRNYGAPKVESRESVFNGKMPTIGPSGLELLSKHHNLRFYVEKPNIRLCIPLALIVYFLVFFLYRQFGQFIPKSKKMPLCPITNRHRSRAAIRKRPLLFSTREPASIIACMNTAPCRPRSLTRRSFEEHRRWRPNFFFVPLLHAPT